MNGSKAAAMLQSLRRNKRGGRPKILRPCPLCMKQFGCAELRKHLPLCRKTQWPLRCNLHLGMEENMKNEPSRFRVFVVDEAGETRISGLESIKKGQVFRFRDPVDDSPAPIFTEYPNQMYGVAMDDGHFIPREEMSPQGGVECECFETLEAALAYPTSPIQ